jgi:hypothetical protein
MEIEYVSITVIQGSGRVCRLFELQSRGRALTHTVILFPPFPSRVFTNVLATGHFRERLISSVACLGAGAHSIMLPSDLFPCNTGLFRE